MTDTRESLEASDPNKLAPMVEGDDESMTAPLETRVAELEDAIQTALYWFRQPYPPTPGYIATFLRSALEGKTK